MTVLDLLLGRRLANAEGEQAKMTELQGVPAMGLDGLSSAAYGPEAALAILIPVGAVGLHVVVPVMGAILVLLTLLALSYWQTIEAYPTNGGSYTVAAENLGRRFGLLAGCALMVDYTLNVAVGISAGIGALTSAVPALHPYTLPLCLFVLALITLANLRGTSEAGAAFGVPTFLFIVSWLALLGWGVAQMVMAGGHPVPLAKPPPLQEAGGSLTAWLILRCFASGCTAMTGVEAVSNGVGSFKDPAVKHAHRTLAAIVVLLAILLAAIAVLCQGYRIGAMDQSKPDYQSVLSQLAAAVSGRGVIYDVAMATVLTVVCLSANTSFVGFPRLCRLLAEDDFLPYAFAMPGRRLVYNLGVLLLAGVACVLLVAFKGITDALIPLFAVGAFLAFALSQTGMARHWSKALRAGDAGRGARMKRAINQVGAVTTTVCLGVIIVGKFIEGAWIVLVAIPCLFVLLLAIRGRLVSVRERLRSGPMEHLERQNPPVVMIPLEDWSALAAKALHFAMRLTEDVRAVHLRDLEGPDAKEDEAHIRADWERNVCRPAIAAGRKPPQLEIVRSEYRQYLKPLLDIVHGLELEFPHRPIAVMVPELVKQRWWDYLLYTYRARQLQDALLHESGRRVVVINVPWRIEEP
jgi:amino acid transporter